jgi:hypothetical protein
MAHNPQWTLAAQLPGVEIAADSLDGQTEIVGDVHAVHWNTYDPAINRCRHVTSASQTERAAPLQTAPLIAKPTLGRLLVFSHELS